MNRRGFIRLLGIATAGAASAPIIERLDWAIRQPASIIKPSHFMDGANTVQITLTNLQKGDLLLCMYDDGEVCFKEESKGSTVSARIPWEGDRNVTIRTRSKQAIYTEFSARVGSNGLTIHTGGLMDRVYTNGY